MTKHNFTVWYNYEFWLYWFESEIDSDNNDFKNIDDYYFNILILLSSNMSNIGIKYKNIINILGEMVKKYNLSIEYVAELDVIVKKQCMQKENLFK
jgi:hypothetical protein